MPERMAELIDVKLIDGTARTVRELFTGRKYGLDYYQRESPKEPGSEGRRGRTA